MDEFTWLKHRDTGGYFHCPAAAVEAWRATGWELTDEPEEPNPAVAEWQPPPVREAPAEDEETPDETADEPPAKKATKKTTKAAARGEDQED